MGEETVRSLIEQGDSLNKTGEFYKAFKKFDKATELFEKAIKKFEKATELDPLEKIAWYNLGTVHSKMGNHESAISAYKKAVEIDDDFFQTWNNIGMSYLTQKLFKESENAFDKAIEANADFPKPYFGKANIAHVKGDISGAVYLVNKAIELDPNYDLAYKLREILLAKVKNEPAANDIKPLFRELRNSIQSKEVAVFIGAGVSSVYPTCFPIWSNYKNLILQSLIKSVGAEAMPGFESKKFIDFLSTIKFKPEVFLELLAQEDQASLPKVLDILKTGEPNILHKLMAKLAASGLVRVFITTNFDCMLEKAFKEEGVEFTTVISGNDFQEFGTEGLKYIKRTSSPDRKKYLKLPPMVNAPGVQFGEGLRMILRENAEARFKNKVILIKLHGCVSDEKSIQMTLTQTSTKLGETKIYSLRYILTQYNVFFLGYSGFDNDIAPEINKIRAEFPKDKKSLEIVIPFFETDLDMTENIYDIKHLKAKKIFWLSYINDSTEAKQMVSSIVSTYKKDFELLETDFEDFAVSITKGLPELNFQIKREDLEMPPNHHDAVQDIYKRQLSEWADAVKLSDRLLMLSNLLLFCKDLVGALVFAKVAQKCCTTDQEILQVHHKIVNIQIKMKNKEGAKKTLASSLELGKKMLEEGEMAEENFNQSIHYSGSVLCKLGLWDEASKTFEDGMAVVKDELGVSRLLIGQTACLIHSKKLNEAEQALNKALKLTEKQVKDIANKTPEDVKELLGAIKTNLGYVNLRQEKYESAKDVLLEAAELVRQTGNVNGQYIVSNRLARAYDMLGDSEQKQYYSKIAEELAKQLGEIEFVNVSD